MKKNSAKTQSSKTTKRLYDSKEACVLLGLSLQSLRRAISLGKIKTVYVGRFLRIPAEEIDRLHMGGESLLSVKEAANQLCVSVAIIRKLIKAGKIEAFRLAEKGPWKVKSADIVSIATEGVTYE